MFGSTGILEYWNTLFQIIGIPVLRYSSIPVLPMKLHTGDTVVIITGKDKGKTGRVLRILDPKNRIVVTGINMRTRHMKKTAQSPGRIVRYEAALSASNVMLVDPKTKKRTRMGKRMIGAKRERFAKKSGEALLSGRKLKALVDQESKNEGKKQKNQKKDDPDSPASS
jgi:large subunit ribosomal protein L24